MSQAPVRLAELQTWMMHAIESARGDAAVIADCVLPSRNQSSSQRLAVYQHGYLARLQECLRDSFPVLLAALGRETFDQFAAEYVQRHPPASYSLNHLADRFVEHLIVTRPNDISAPGWPDFIIGLAHLEHTIEQVFDGPGSEDLPPIDLTALLNVPAHRLQLVPDRSLRLLSFSFPINDYYSAVKSGESSPWPQAGASWLAVMRRNYIVRRIPLEQAEHQLLSALIVGQSLADVLAASSAITGEVADWFIAWGRLGLFQRMESYES
jgi:hypothetical protein